MARKTKATPAPKSAGTAKEPLWNERARKKLASSGLTMEDAKLLGIEVLTAEQMSAEDSKFHELCALRFTYHGIDGKPCSDIPGGPVFHRYRYLEDPPDFSAQTGNGMRYVQKPNTLPVAYLPTSIDWVKVAADTSESVIITEGELKAAKTCKEGFSTIGLGGVSNWRSKKRGVLWLDDMKKVDWVRRKVFIVFDSDARTNMNICRETWDLSQELRDRGAYVYFIFMPEIPGLAKVGLDDYLVHEGANSAKKLAELLAGAEPLGLCTALWELNKRFVYIANPGFILDERTQYKIAPAAFTSHHQASAMYQERVLRKDGTMSYKPVPAAAAWIKWPVRREVDMLTYAPGKPLYVEEQGLRKLNTWKGLAVQPVKGDVTPFLTLLAHLLTGNEPVAMPWLLKWFAYMFQYPGVKMFTAIMMHGLRHGTGKSLIGVTLGRIFGDNYVYVREKDLRDGFNSWAENKQFALGDEIITKDSKYGAAEMLKCLITQLEIRINEKFIPAYNVPDCLNYFLTSNHADALLLENDDRRLAVFEVTVGPLPEKFYLDYMKWLDNGGAEALLYYFENDVDCDDFNPAAPALVTSAKERMIETNLTDSGAWVRTLLENPVQLLRLGNKEIKKDLFTSKELYTLFAPDGSTKITVMGLGRELAKHGIRQVYQGRPVTLHNGTSARFFAVRNADYWLSAPLHAIITHLEEFEKTGETKKRKF